MRDSQVKKIQTMWTALEEVDKKRISYPPRFRDKLVQGRFKASKSNVAPGVESLRR